jgi:hypothetical protein
MTLSYFDFTPSRCEEGFPAHASRNFTVNHDLELGYNDQGIADCGSRLFQFVLSFRLDVACPVL